MVFVSYTRGELQFRVAVFSGLPRSSSRGPMDHTLCEEKTMQRCPTCHREHVIKHGSVTGKPHKRWKPCGYQCTRPRRHRKPLTMQINTVLLSLSGGPMHRIACLLRVSAQSVLNGSALSRRSIMSNQSPRGEPSSSSGMRGGTLSRRSDGSCGSGSLGS